MVRALDEQRGKLGYPAESAELRAEIDSLLGANPTTGPPLTRLLSSRQVCEMTSISRTGVWRLVKAGRFPSPIPLAGIRKAWIASEVQAWIDDRIAKARRPRAEQITET